MLFPLLEAFPQVWRGLAFSSRNSWVAFLSVALLDSRGFFPAPAGTVQVPVSQVSAQLSPPIPTQGCTEFAVDCLAPAALDPLQGGSPLPLCVPTQSPGAGTLAGPINVAICTGGLGGTEATGLQGFAARSHNWKNF